MIELLNQMYYKDSFIIIIIIYIILPITNFTNQLRLVVFDFNLNDSKFLQISWTLPSILTDLNVLFWVFQFFL